MDNDYDYFDLLTEEELELNRRFRECTSMEELQKVAEETKFLNENTETIRYPEISMTLEEFKQKYNMIDIRDLKGKYGF